MEYMKNEQVLKLEREVSRLKGDIKILIKFAEFCLRANSLCAVAKKAELAFFELSERNRKPPTSP